MVESVMQLAIEPMLAKAGKVPDDDDNYGFEIKWDGLRALTYLEVGRLRILSRNLKEITEKYPELVALSHDYPRRQLILDGEIVALTKDGRPSFSRLQQRMNLASVNLILNRSRAIPITYFIFDLLYLDGQSLMGQPYNQRRAILENLNLVGAAWQTPKSWRGGGRSLLAASQAMGLEGVIAKRLDSHYQAGKRSGAWLKIKNQKRQELVIAGWAPGKGKRAGQIGALLVGYYELPPAIGQADNHSRLVYAGKVGTGFSDQQLVEIKGYLEPLRQRTCPFTEPPVQGAVYVEPSLVGEFEFTEWTPHGTLRHPSFKGLRFDKEAGQVIRECP